MAASRDNRIQIRLTDEERDLFSAASDRAGESLSVWLRRAGRERLIREKMADMGVIPFAVPRRRRAK